jgi:hypothetical protein
VGGMWTVWLHLASVYGPQGGGFWHRHSNFNGVSPVRVLTMQSQSPKLSANPETKFQFSPRLLRPRKSIVRYPLRVGDMRANRWMVSARQRVSFLRFRQVKKLFAQIHGICWTRL